VEERPITHLILNWFIVEDETILVGATDNERWRWDVEDGYSGADAKSVVFIEMKINEKGQVTSEVAGFHSRPGSPERSVTMSNIEGLFDVAWIIKNEKLDEKAARKRFFGMEINHSK
jgi:hypothetical protein